MVEFFKTQMGHTFYEGTVPRIARALERIANALEKRKFDTPAWERNDIQFARLLAEMRATGLTPGIYRELCVSMDLRIEEIDEILERAEDEWNRIKAAK